MSTVVCVTLADGTFHEEVGCGTGKLPSKGAALEQVSFILLKASHCLTEPQCKKEAIANALAQTLCTFGKVLEDMVDCTNSGEDHGNDQVSTIVAYAPSS